MSQNPGPGYGQTPPPGQPYGYPPQQPATQPYGQPQQPATQSYGQPPQQAQPYAYPPQQAPAQPYGYPAQQAPAQPYGQPVQGFAPTPTDAYGATAAPTKKSPILGVLALAIVVISGVVLTLYLQKIGAVAGPYAVNGTLDTTTQPQLVADVTSQLGGILPMLGGASIFTGLIGWILGIVAAASKRGRGFGVMAIVLGVLAPIIAVIVLVVTLMPYLQAS
jgi:hypothetical protein